MNPKPILLISLTAFMVSSGSSVTTPQTSAGGEIILNFASFDPSSRSNYALPKNDFVTFSIDGQKGLFTGAIDQDQLLKDARFALCCMGRIPPIRVTLFDNGYVSGFVQVGSADFASNPRLLTKKSIRLNVLGDYEEKRAELLKSNHIYILDEETISYTHYFFVTLSDKDFPNEERFYSKLSDMTRKLYKGANADYYFENFTQSEQRDANDDGLLELKIYYLDFMTKLGRDQVFTQEDSKRIFGREFVLKRGIYFNKEYVITWYGF